MALRCRVQNIELRFDFSGRLLVESFDVVKCRAIATIFLAERFHDGVVVASQWELLAVLQAVAIKKEYRAFRILSSSSCLFESHGKRSISVLADYFRFWFSHQACFCFSCFWQLATDINIGP